jgi:hypothetical protein
VAGQKAKKVKFNMEEHETPAKKRPIDFPFGHFALAGHARPTLQERYIVTW